MKETSSKMLNDDTEIGGSTWNNLKNLAMQYDYKEQSFYKELVDEESLYLLEALRSAQLAQGNME